VRGSPPQLLQTTVSIVHGYCEVVNLVSRVDDLSTRFVNPGPTSGLPSRTWIRTGSSYLVDVWFCAWGRLSLQSVSCSENAKH